jgi:hypothetical protein
VDATYDIGRIEDVHFNPWFSSAHPFVFYQTTHGRAFVFGRSDWEYVFCVLQLSRAVTYAARCAALSCVAAVASWQLLRAACSALAPALALAARTRMRTHACAHSRITPHPGMPSW